LPIDYLKIDGQFTGNVVTDPVSRSMVQAIASIAQAMGIGTVAERVDSDDVLTALRALGIGHAQGALLSPPRPLKAFPR